MDAYKTPAADLNASIKIFSPVKAIVYGLCISIILASIASIIESIAFGFALGLDFTDESAFESALADSIVFMIFDIAMSALICFFAGKTVGKRVQGQEAKYGVIVSLLTISIYLPLFIISDAFTIWPIWYNFLALRSYYRQSISEQSRLLKLNKYINERHFVAVQSAIKALEFF